MRVFSSHSYWYIKIILCSGGSASVIMWEDMRKQAVKRAHSSSENHASLLGQAKDLLGYIPQSVHFLRILQWWGKTVKGPILSLLPPPLGSMQSKVWAEYRKHELSRGSGGNASREIFKIAIGVSEIAFPEFWEHILKKSQLLKTNF
jgi:hypothetical protein